jgi:cytochrome c5
MDFRVKYSKHGNLTGQRFERWIVLRKGPERFICKNGKSGEFMYWCRCDCGNEKYVKPSSLYDGDSKSCGCLRSEMKAGKHLYGKRFGNITVIERSQTYRSDKEKRFLYRCFCHVCEQEFLSGISKIHKGASCGCIPQGARLPKGEGGFNAVWNEYVNGSQKRKLQFDLTREQFRDLITKNCHYCDSPPSSVKLKYQASTNWGKFVYNGIDRMDNSKGYTSSNSITCCSSCNIAKGTLSYYDFIEKARKIALFHPPVQICIEP